MDANTHAHIFIHAHEYIHKTQRAGCRNYTCLVAHVRWGGGGGGGEGGGEETVVQKPLGELRPIQISRLFYYLIRKNKYMAKHIPYSYWTSYVFSHNFSVLLGNSCNQ